MADNKKSSYSEQIKSPKWQKKRLEVLNLRGFKCEKCGCEEKQLHVHHRFYIKGRLIHEYDNDVLQVLCEDCHKKEHIQKKSKTKTIEVIPEKYMELISEIEKHNNIYSEDILDDIVFIIGTINDSDSESGFIHNLAEAFNTDFYNKISIDLRINSQIERFDVRLFCLEKHLNK